MKLLQLQSVGCGRRLGRATVTVEEQEKEESGCVRTAMATINPDLRRWPGGLAILEERLWEHGHAANRVALPPSAQRIYICGTTRE
jgi:hypothetical protein